MFVRALLPPGEKARDSFFFLPLSPPFPLRSLSRASLSSQIFTRYQQIVSSGSGKEDIFPHAHNQKKDGSQSGVPALALLPLRRLEIKIDISGN